MKRWAEISTKCERERMTALSAAISAAGVENEVSFIEVGESEFPEAARQALGQFDQLRVGGPHCEAALSLSARLPSTMLTLKAADAIVKENGDWWPRNFLADAVSRAIIVDLKGVDITGAVFVLGTNCEARAVVGALSRMGFSRFNISDPVDERGQAFVEEMKRLYFRVQFQFVARHTITQLPSVHSVAVNTLHAGQDEAALGELFYFNFLKAGGLWLDLVLQPANSHLEAEAKAVGAVVESSWRVAAWTDYLWARSVFGVEIDLQGYSEALGKTFSSTKNSDV